jgi:hypothetical protein
MLLWLQFRLSPELDHIMQMALDCGQGLFVAARFSGGQLPCPFLLDVYN